MRIERKENLRIERKEKTQGSTNQSKKRQKWRPKAQRRQRPTQKQYKHKRCLQILQKRLRNVGAFWLMPKKGQTRANKSSKQSHVKERQQKGKQRENNKIKEVSFKSR